MFKKLHSQIVKSLKDENFMLNLLKTLRRNLEILREVSWKMGGENSQK